MKIKLKNIISQATEGKYVDKPEQEKYITVFLYGRGIKERKISEGKTPVSFNAWIAHTGQLIYSRINAEHGAFAIVPKELDGAVVSKDFPLYDIDTTQIVPQYLMYALISDGFVNKAKKNSFGATMRRLKETVFESMEIELPDINRQYEIIRIMEQSARLIDMRRQELQKLDDLVKARFVEMFGDPKYIKNNLVKISDTGFLTSGGTPSRSRSEYFTGNIRWYSAGELNSLYLPDSIEHITEDAIEQSSAKLFEKDTLMIGMYDTAAFKMGILTEESSSNQACANLKPTDKYNVIWLYYLFNIMKPMFLNERQGVRQKNLSLSKIKDFVIPSAPIEQQEQFAAFVKQTDKSKVAVQKSLDEAQLLFDSLMQKYFG